MPQNFPHFNLCRAPEEEEGREKTVRKAFAYKRNQSCSLLMFLRQTQEKRHPVTLTVLPAFSTFGDFLFPPRCLPLSALPHQYAKQGWSEVSYTKCLFQQHIPQPGLLMWTEQDWIPHF